MADLFGSDELFAVFETETNPQKRKRKRQLKAAAQKVVKEQNKNSEDEPEEGELGSKDHPVEVDPEEDVVVTDKLPAQSGATSSSNVIRKKKTVKTDSDEEIGNAAKKIKKEVGSKDCPVELGSDEDTGKDFDALPVVKLEPEDKEKKSKKSKTSTPSDKLSAPDAAKVQVKTEEDEEEQKPDQDEDEFDYYNDGNVLLGKTDKLKADLDLLQKHMPQVEVKTLDTPEGSGCTHVVATPKDTFYIPLHPIEKPVKTYSFKLDLFQERAVQCVDNYQSVLVSAHTSAGKTVVAEYAIAKGLKDNQRVIYTTPIKALSNQKYREFYEEFKDVGLITGDVTINPSAGCLIMTTEILRNMLYRGSEIMREVGWVVFDEIHYMRDKERGVVWEETIILLPQKTHYVFLSATIPNAHQFAQWITHLHKQPCNVIHTEYRPVPLHHYIFPTGSDGIHLIVDEAGTFREDAFNTAMGMLQNTEGAGGGGGRGGRRPQQMKGEDSPCHKVIKMAMERDLAPVIVFSFSKKDCEVYALQMSRLDFNSAEDKQLVEEVFQNAIDVLSKDDQKLPQVENLLPLLKRGIGIHHGGLLPLLKETIEILFGEGLIKVLFATETFAMGLNMPARTVLFTNVRKFDGKDYRWITSGEYIQMSGRAGRRGIDDKGITIVMMDEKISPSVGRGLLKGSADAINSAFHLTYNMVLNLMRVEEINPEFMMERSFFQFQNYSQVPAVCEKLLKSQAEYAAIVIPREEEVASYFVIRKQLVTLAKEFKTFISKPKYVIPFMQPGRMVNVQSGENCFGWGAVVRFARQEKPPNAKPNPLTDEPVYFVDVLLKLHLEGSNSRSTSDIRPAKPNEPTDIKIVPVALEAISQISQARLYLPGNLDPRENKLAAFRGIEEVQKRFPEGVPILDPIKDMKIKDDAFIELCGKIKNFESALNAHVLHNLPETPDLHALYVSKMAAYDKVQEAKAELRKAKSLLQMDELKCRKRVLRRLGYSSGDDVIEIKGRVACELTSADELLLTEMIFNGMFIDIDVPQIVSLLSCMVCDERSNNAPKLSDQLSGALKMMQDMARQIVKVSKECKMEIDEDAYVDQFKPFLMDVVHEWCNGASFSKICEMTDIFEGGIIRCMRRLEELLRQMSLAAKVIGNKELEEKFNQGIKLLKRDIVFAASLYL